MMRLFVSTRRNKYLNFTTYSKTLRNVLISNSCGQLNYKCFEPEQIYKLTKKVLRSICNGNLNAS